MSETGPQQPGSQQPGPQQFDLSYESMGEHRNAPMLVKLAGIFNLVVAGIDVLYGLVIVVGIIFLSVMIGKLPPPGAGGPVGPGGAGGPGGPWGPGGGAGRPPMAVMYGLYGAYAVASLGVAPVKIIGALKLLRRKRGAWGWGLAAGIVGCVQIWCSLGCVVPMGAGIYTIVILCLDHVCAYLRSSTEVAGR